MFNKIDAYQSINNNIAKPINNALKWLPKSQVCKVEEVKGNKVKVSRMLENNNTIGYTDDVPIIRPIYFYLLLQIILTLSKIKKENHLTYTH